MAALANKTAGVTTIQHYGVGPFGFLNQTVVSAGGANNMIINAANAATLPPCAAEIVSIAYNGATGTYLVTFAGNHFAVADWDIAIDDLNGATPVQGYLGQWANLGTNVPTTAIMTTYVNNAASNVAINTPVHISIMFKEDGGGAAA